MNRIVILLSVLLLLSGGLLSYITVTAYFENRHLRSSQDAYERYRQSQSELSDSYEEQEETTEEVMSTGTDGHRITPFRIVNQYPELPTGCEITAMTMVLNYYGYSVDKMDMAFTYLPRTEAEFYIDETGTLIGPDMEKYFVGDPTGEGYICGNTAIETAANRYLNSVNSRYVAKALDDCSPELLYQFIEEDTPVVVWVTINMEDREETDGWYLEDGSYMEWSENDHGAVLIGYDSTTVTIADPIYDIVTCSRERFERIFQERGSQCVILQDELE